MVWDGDKVYLAWRRQAGRKALLNANQTYESLISVISYQNGTTIAQLPLPSVDRPMLSVLNDKMLTVTHEGKLACYVNGISAGGPVELSREPRFGNLEMGPLVAAHLLSVYVVLVY